MFQSRHCIPAAGEHDAALKLHQAHLNIARILNDKAGMGRAYGNIGNAHSAMAYYEQVRRTSMLLSPPSSYHNWNALFRFCSTFKSIVHITYQNPFQYSNKFFNMANIF